MLWSEEGGRGQTAVRCQAIKTSERGRNADASESFYSAADVLAELLLALRRFKVKVTFLNLETVSFAKAPAGSSQVLNRKLSVRTRSLSTGKHNFCRSTKDSVLNNNKVVSDIAVTGLLLQGLTRKGRKI